MSAARIPWTPEAERRLRKAPFFIRPLVRRRAEQAARERNLPQVTTELLDALKSAEHRG